MDSLDAPSISATCVGNIAEIVNRAPMRNASIQTTLKLLFMRFLSAKLLEQTMDPPYEKI